MATRRWDDYANGYCQPVREAFVEEAMDLDDPPLPAGAPDFIECGAAYARAKWIGPPRGWTNPVDEVKGAVLGMADRPAGEITPPELLGVLRAVERRGCIETARRLRQRLSMIFAYGVAEGLIDHDPAARLAVAMRKGRPPRPQPALTTIEACRALLAACDGGPGGVIVKLASRFLALTAVRLAAVRGMRLGEIEDIDGPEPLWRVPAVRMKLTRAKKGEARYDHLVPLSAAAVAVLRQTLSIFPASNEAEKMDRLVFASRAGHPIGEGAIGALYARAGFAGRHVPHGWRASFSTILNETLGDEWRASIDRALAHSPKDKVEAAYNRSAQLDRRRAVFDRWGAMLAGNT